MNRELYKIRPLDGFGRLHFGCSANDMHGLTDIYGAITKDLEFKPQPEDNKPAADDKAVSPSGGSTSGEISKRHRPTVRRIVFQNSLFLDFIDDKLVTIQLYNGVFPAFFEHQDVFQPAGRAMIGDIARALDDRPYIDGSVLCFNDWAFVLCGYCWQDGGEIIWRVSEIEPQTLMVGLAHETKTFAKSELARLKRLSF